MSLRLRYILSGVIIVLIGILGWLFAQPPGDKDASKKATQQATNTQAYLQVNDRCLTLAVADTPQKRRQGLSGYSDLASDEGMLFVYESLGKRGFWMKEMSFPIDIIWLDASNRVVTIKRFAQPDSFPQSFYPDRPAKNVIETVAGFTKSENINSGDRLTVTKPTTTTPVVC